jgi:hypothetical protein
MSDAWVWDMYRPARFVRKVRVVTSNDVNVEELSHRELAADDAMRMPHEGPPDPLPDL